MNRILPYLPLSKPITGVEAARQLDADTFEGHADLVAFCRPMIEGEFIGAPQALRDALAQPLMRPFRHLVEVRRGGGLFENERQVLQVRMVEGFDPTRDGQLRAGFLTNNTNDRQPEPMSKGDASLSLIAPPSSK